MRTQAVKTDPSGGRRRLQMASNSQLTEYTVPARKAEGPMLRLEPWA